MELKNGFGKNIIFIRYFGYSITQGDFSGLRPGGRVVLNFPDRAGCGERAFYSSTCASGSTSCGAVLRPRSGSFTVVGLGVGHFRFQGCFLYRAVQCTTDGPKVLSRAFCGFWGGVFAPVSGPPAPGLALSVRSLVGSRAGADVVFKEDCRPGVQYYTGSFDSQGAGIPRRARASRGLQLL